MLTSSFAKVLPRDLKLHLIVPLQLLFVWSLIAGGLLLTARKGDYPEAIPQNKATSLAEINVKSPSATQNSENSKPTDVNAAIPGPNAKTRIIRARGLGEFIVSEGIESQAKSVTENGGQSLNFEIVDGKISLKDSQSKVVWRYKSKESGESGDEKGSLYGPSGQVEFKVKIKEAENKVKIRKQDGSELYSLKIKEDKFNIYDANGNRIQKGKYKKGQYVVRSDDDSSSITEITGANDLDEAGIMALPIPWPARAIIWQLTR
jgi:hypothetical protein